jgi:hypothetical protein
VKGLVRGTAIATTTPAGPGKEWVLCRTRLRVRQSPDRAPRLRQMSKRGEEEEEEEEEEEQEGCLPLPELGCLAT